MSIDGIIGQTKQPEYVTQWEIFYHKIFSILNTFKAITNLGLRETEICSMFIQLSIEKGCAEFISKKWNSYKTQVPILYNFVSDTNIPSADTKKGIKLLYTWKRAIWNFSNKNQSKKLFDTIHN